MHSAFSTLTSTCTAEPDPIKGSRFIAYGAPVRSDAEAMLHLQSVRTKHPGCRHCAWAYVLENGDYRSSDDGEPGGSAGRPILSHLHGEKVGNVCVAVVRYFGGTKLGVGGLIRAYGGAARQLLLTAPLIEVLPRIRVVVVASFSDQALVERSIPKDALVEREFGQDVRYTISLVAGEERELSERLGELSAGRIKAQAAPPSS